MTVLLGCCAYVAAVFVATSIALCHGTWHIWHPRLALSLWHAALISALLTVVVGTGYALGVAHAGSNEIAADPAHGLILAVGPWVEAALIAIIAALLLASSERIIRTDFGDRERLRDLLLEGAHRRENDGDLVIHTLDASEVLMCAFRTPTPTVVTSRAVRDLLSPAEFQAVLEHERAHLYQRHHLAVLLGLVSSSWFPTMRLASRLRRSSFLLVELIADDTAARRCGHAALAAALSKMADHTGDRALAARADRIASRGLSGQPCEISLTVAV